MPNTGIQQTVELQGRNPILITLLLGDWRLLAWLNAITAQQQLQSQLNSSDIYTLFWQLWLLWMHMGRVWNMRWIDSGTTPNLVWNKYIFTTMMWAKVEVADQAFDVFSCSVVETEREVPWDVRLLFWPHKHDSQIILPADIISEVQKFIQLATCLLNPLHCTFLDSLMHQLIYWHIESRATSISKVLMTSLSESCHVNLIHVLVW